MDSNKIYHLLALSLIPGIGPVNAKNLISYCGSAEKVFSASQNKLKNIPGIGMVTAAAIANHDTFQRAEEELLFIEKKNITCLTYWDEAYPQRLKNCIDAPLILFYAGNANLNNERCVGIVGTRNATEYGKAVCEKLVEELKQFQILMISGLAYGIDVAAHKACIKHDIATVGVVGHGLDRIYPATHKETAHKMQENGGLLTEFLSKTLPDRQNFPRRNRIVAGMVDALVVVETANDGGAVLTAAIADSYNRDVFAIPGDVDNKYSKGCNFLIKTEKARLIENANDVTEAMGWQTKNIKPKAQRELFIEFTEDEKKIYHALKENGELAIDELTVKVSLTPGTLAGNLLNLEFQNVIQVLPGKRYKLK